MGINDNILSLIQKTPDVILNNVAQRVKQRRLELNFTQKTLALRAGIPLPTYRRFERTGEIAFRNLLMLGVALNMTDEFEGLFSQKAYKTMDDLLKNGEKNVKEEKAMEKINVVEVLINSKPVGRIALTEENLCAFEYNTEFITTGFSISPYFLPLKTELFIAKRSPFRGNFGVFDDSLPDGWGNLILDRYLKERGIDAQKLTLLQRLSLVGTNGRGALEYFPDKSFATDNDFLEFDKLAADSQKILSSEYSGDMIETFYKNGGSSGGARPKVFTQIDGKQWLVKFKASIDPENIGEIEYEYSGLARKCGIDMPNTRLFDNKYFAVERFDRTEKEKIHTISAAGLLNADYRIPSLDYSDLLKICFNLTKNMEEVLALFRLMLFNIAISNRDDHAKNFSFQYKNEAWKLSPAYDILPSSGFNGYHTTTINGKGEPTLKDILQVASEVKISASKANEIINSIVETCHSENKLNYHIK